MLLTLSAWTCGRVILKKPDDLLAPRDQVFAEPWHAQTLAAAFALVKAGHLTAGEWAEALGAELARAEAEAKPDTEETYYLAALEALEKVTPIEQSELVARKSDWESAYRNTPHGKPVVLGA